MLDVTCFLSDWQRARCNIQQEISPRVCVCVWHLGASTKRVHYGCIGANTIMHVISAREQSRIHSLLFYCRSTLSGPKRFFVLLQLFRRPVWRRSVLSGLSESFICWLCFWRPAYYCLKNIVVIGCVAALQRETTCYRGAPWEAVLGAKLPS